MGSSIGITIVSHSEKLAEGLVLLIREVAKDVEITYVGGFDSGIGTNFEKTLEAIENNQSNTIYAFFDLGSARMNLESASEVTEKKVKIYNVPLVEGAYTTAALLQVGTPEDEINKQLLELQINK